MNKTKFRAIIFLLLLGIGFFLVFKNIRISLTLNSILKACSVDGTYSANSLNYGCFKSKMNNLITQDNLPIIVKSLEKIYISQSSQKKFGSLTCHGPAHAIGELAVSKGFSMDSIYKGCTRGCDYGCIHGASMQIIRNETDFGKSYFSFCDRFNNSEMLKDKTSCYHIVGHGLVELTSRDIKKALGFCDKLNDEFLEMNCGQGVVMEYLLGDNDNPKPFDANQNNIVDFCNSLPGNYKSVCLSQAGFYGYSLMDDKNKAGYLCNLVPAKDKESCFTNLGQRAYFAYINSVDEVTSYCNQFGEPSSSNCIKGAVQSSVDFDSNAKDALAICKTQNSDDQTACFGILGERYEYSYGKDKRIAFCGTLKSNQERLCLGEIWPSTNEVTELKNKINKMVSNLGPQKAYDEIKKTYDTSKPHSSVVPHLAAHLFGEALYKKLGLSGISICDGSFTYGCYHGFFDIAISQNGIDYIGNLNQICVDLNGVAEITCQHGIGHGIADFYGPQKLDLALKRCVDIDNSVIPFGCVGGVFMEYNFPSLFGDKNKDNTLTRKFDETKPYFPCDTLDSQFSRACYFRITEWWEVVLNKDYKQIGVLCDNLSSKKYKSACFMGIGAALITTNDFDSDKASEYCNLMPRMEGKMNCLVGAAFIFKTTNNLDMIAKICSLSADKNECELRMNNEAKEFLVIQTRYKK